MGGFFYGWRRKTGCVTLVLACLLAAGWIRSQENLSLSFSLDQQYFHQLTLTSHGIEWMKERHGQWKDYKFWLIPYEVLAYPLTLISAWLLLSKPKTRTIQPSQI